MSDMPEGRLEFLVEQAKMRMQSTDYSVRERTLVGILHPRPEVLRALLLSFETGYTLPTKTLVELERLHATLTAAMPLRWRSRAIFEDDANFSPDRYWLISRTRRLAGEELGLAINQARRLLAAGAVDVEYLMNLTQVSATFREELTVYAPGLEARLHSLNTYKGSGQTSPYINKVKQDIRQELDTLYLRRQQVFRDVWLPNLLPAEEYARVRQLPTALLLDLYASQYAAGYDGYRAHMLAQREGVRA